MNIKRMSVFLSSLLLSATLLAADEREISVALTVPDAAWEISIDEVYQVNNEIWVISTVSRNPDIMGAQVISVVKDSVKCTAEDLPVKHFVIGKTWNWSNKEPTTFINTRKELEQDLKQGHLLYKRTKKKK